MPVSEDPRKGATEGVAPHAGQTGHRPPQQRLRPVWRRMRERLYAPALDFLTKPEGIRSLRRLPSLPSLFRRRFAAHRGAWDRKPREVPERLRTVPGIWRDPKLEQEAFEKGPLSDFVTTYGDAIVWTYRQMWRSIIPVAPRLLRAREHAEAAYVPHGVDADDQVDPALTADLKTFAGTIGLSAVGVAPYDPKYEFFQYHGKQVGSRVIVCVLEQNYEATQEIPCARAEQTALSTYAEVMELGAQLAEFLAARGHGAAVHGPEGQNVVIHYAVQAGLGQLGLNGQLLTPEAGSRCRIITINTDAPLEIDSPVDYGIHAICDECKACIERCPVGAIPSQRDWHRGVKKIKINTKRCLPIVAQIDGCAICMKVCPVQKYGLTRVVDHYEAHGQILGRGTAELEGYYWPLDGRFYGPGEKPRIPLELVAPEGVDLNPPPARPEGERARIWS